MPIIPGGGALSAFIRDAANEGLTSTAALNRFRGAGGSIRTQSFYREWGQQLHRDFLAQGWSTRDLARRPSAEMIGEWAAARPGLYAYHGTLPKVDIATGLATHEPWTIFSDRLITPNTAMQMALDEATLRADESGSPVSFGTPSFSGVWQTTGRAAG